MKIFAVAFTKSTYHTLQALEGFCDTYYCPYSGALPIDLGGRTEVDALGIPFADYQVCLIFSDALLPGQRYLLEQCQRYGIQVIGNQHGYNKTVLDIAPYTPNYYTRWWNGMGRYVLDLYEKSYGRPAFDAGWIALGSLKHDCLHRAFRWDAARTNGKVLLLYEPDTDECEGDPVPLRSTYITARVIKALKHACVGFDLKIHPNWPEFVSSFGKPMWRPEADISLVDISMEEMLSYELVIGCWSSALLDAACMGMPVLNVNYPDYPTAFHSTWVPGEIGLFARCEAEQVPASLEAARGWRCDGEKLAYLVGPVGKTRDIFNDFLKRHYAF